MRSFEEYVLKTMFQFYIETLKKMKGKKRRSPSEKEKILLEAKEIGVRKILTKYNISSSLFYSWKECYNYYGIDGFLKKQNQELSTLKLELKKIRDQNIWHEKNIALYNDILKLIHIDDISIKDRIELIRLHNKKGIKLYILFDILKITKRDYYSK